MSFGLLNVVPKNSSGEPVSDFRNTIINFGATDGEYREGKEWLALVKFFSEMEERNKDGLPVVDSYWREPQSALQTNER
jgi:hypothetical protein